jgi:aspartyl-tRNA(Asn)/glutamyl-tRNA(Gln) amidotransferase subunit A
MPTNLYEISATDLIKLYKAGQASPVEAIKSVLERIEHLNATFNAFCIVDGEKALLDAKESEKRWHRDQPFGPVDGIPSTIKDLILSKDWPTLKGSKTIDPKQNWTEDAPIVARMREHGAVFIGKTTTPEFGWKGVTDSPLTGSTKNPWDSQRTPGGSSGGAAVASALGMGHLNIGSDGGGSIRMPAGFCGIFGLKATFGLVPAYPQTTMGTLSHQGPMTRTVNDAARMLSVITKPDHRDWYASPYREIEYENSLEGDIKGMKIAFSPTLGYANVQGSVAAKVQEGVRIFEDLGTHITEIDPPITDPIEHMITLWSVGLAILVEGTPKHQRYLMDSPLLELAEAGRRVSVLQLRKAEQAREELAVKITLFLQEYDFLITPQLALTAFEAGNEVPPNSGMERWWEWSPFTYPFNLTQHPVASVPCGFTTENLPVSLQVVGSRFDEARLLKLCHAFEIAKPFKMPKIV